ncbi:MAG: von Willebrand factor type A domain-containing protein, partial [Cyclobacteriaceae bacterium]|nr:von Willebrand factor type A domain-containing protein [Cyclobacteriaceae bacterium]
YSIKVKDENSILVFSFVGFVTREVRVGSRKIIDIKLISDNKSLDEVVVIGYATESKKESHPMNEASVPLEKALRGKASGLKVQGYNGEPGLVHNTEEYDAISENIFHSALNEPLSTFSIDVDAASYSNMRRFINNGQIPPKDVVRIEEMINYFNYDYPQPKGEHPFNVISELADAPWNPNHKLVHIGLQGLEIPTEDLPASNLVFLIDVSGSMNSPNKLPLLKSAFNLLLQELRPQDQVAIVVYAGAAGVVLPSTSGACKSEIVNALNQLSAGGSTAGGAGIKLAYRIASENYIEGGNNRIIIATDGDFNVGESSNAAMERLVETERDRGVFLTVLGFGMGNYKDSKMETLADKGNGNYAYIDNITEAKKVLVNEFGGTLFTIAKDVKLQIEFNPAKVQAYRLIGYENRKLNNEDFENDKKDAGELGSGHTVTALYEIIPVGVKSEFIKITDLKYQKIKPERNNNELEEWMTVKFRYKKPDGLKSVLLSHVIKGNGEDFNQSSEDFKWSASVASFGMLLRDSEFKQNCSFDMTLKIAREARGEDKEGYRAEFIKLVESVMNMKGLGIETHR